VTVVSGAVDHLHTDLADAALRMMQRNMDARVLTSGEVDFSG
jgi:hypothetical protein